MMLDNLRRESFKISIIVPMYNVEKLITRCINSLISQTYKNIEIIIVNDGSTDNSDLIVEELAKKDTRISLIKHDKNLGLYQARITGVEASTGDFIGFVDSDDFVSIDYFRSLLYQAVRTKADITIGKIVQIDEQGYKYIQNIYDSYEVDLKEKEDVLNAYWGQEGHCFMWHTIWNKLYKSELWENALLSLKLQKDHLIMCEDFVFSSIIFSFANKVTSSNLSYYYYYRNSNASTSLSGGINKYKKNISDVITAFKFVRCFICDKTNHIDIIEKLNNWETLYKFFWSQNVLASNLTDYEKASLFEKLNKGLIDGKLSKNPEYFYKVNSEFDDRYDLILDMLNDDSTKCLSLDVFDTALIRPFYDPKDLFKLVEKVFKKKYPLEKRTFYEIRTKAEEDLRSEIKDIKNSKKEEITLLDIYARIKEYTDLSLNQINEIMLCEMDYELKYSLRRESVYNLYIVAKHLNKKIIFISDMYLSSKSINRMLLKSGYELEEIFVSSDYNCTKRTSNLYLSVLSKINITPTEILHLGDNWESDFLAAKKIGLNAIFYPKATDCLLFNISDINTTHAGCAYKRSKGTIINYEYALSHLGNRSAFAMAANKLYDQPFISYHQWSEMNSSPQYFGYFALGMHLLGVMKWITDDVQKCGYQKLLFVSRDGYLPMKAYESIKMHITNLPNYEYFYTSRKAAIPCGIRSVNDLYLLYPVFNSKRVNLKYMLDMLSPLLNLEEMRNLENINVFYDKNICNYSDFCYLIKNYITPLFDENKASYFQNQISNFFDSKLMETTAMVDIGYSGRTQEMIYNTTKRSVDAYYIHSNDDLIREREKKCGFKIKTFYDFTPSITGAERELLFSSLEPSCIKYELSKDGKIIPSFEEKEECNYPQYYLISESQNNALSFINDFFSTFIEDIDIMEFRNIEISYPFEYYLGCLTEADLRLFDCCTFEDDMWLGEDSIISKVWEEHKSYHQVVPYTNILNSYTSHQMENMQTTNLAWQLYNQKKMENSNKIKKSIFWLINDKEMFKRRFKDFFLRK